MNIEEYQDYCLSKPGTTEETPFGPDTLVFKVMGKVFAISGIDEFDFVNLKCTPEYAIQLREKYNGSIRPGYHMDKKHWNSVSTLGEVPDRMIYELIDHSYNLIVEKLPKKLKAELNDLLEGQ